MVTLGRPPHGKNTDRPPIQALLWDNDGVLVNTEELFYQANREFFLDRDINLTRANFFDWFLADSCGAWHLLDLAPGEITACRAERNRRYNALLTDAPQLQVPGIDTLLSRLVSRVRMGIVTSARPKDFHTIHSRLALLPHFEFVVAEGDYALSKPAPDPYLRALTLLGLAPQDCLVIEDSPRGLASAQAAGIGCIVIRSALTANCAFHGARHVVDSCQELGELLLSLCPLPLPGG